MAVRLVSEEEMEVLGTAKEPWLTWRWARSSAWTLAGFMAMSLMRGGAAQQLDGAAGAVKANALPASRPVQLNPKSGGPQLPAGGGMGFDTYGTLLSLCFMFVVGVSTGFLWRSTENAEEEATQSRARASPALLLPAPPPNNRGGGGETPRAPVTVGVVRQYTLQQIEDMTDGFKVELGRGGQGVVYLATLPEEADPLRRTAAVKRLQQGSANLLVPAPEHNQRSQDALEREFWAELNAISRLHHRNLVALLGYCVEADDLFLVYELMDHGSLREHLHGDTDGSAPPPPLLDWCARMRCALEVAQGLEYLHSHASPSLVHRDIKSNNILFDDAMHAKIADFGLSKPLPLVGRREVMVSNPVRGTPGYVDPVYLNTGHACDKVDVYSFGVVLLELVTGRRPIQHHHTLAAWCRDFLGSDDSGMRRRVQHVLDPRLTLDASYDEVYDVVRVALACVRDRQENRPTMRDVVIGLRNARCRGDSSGSDTSGDAIHLGLPDFSNARGGGFFNGSPPAHPPLYLRPSPLPSYEIKDNAITVKCTVGSSRIAMRCKIWPTPRNFGFNKVETTLNGAFLWKNRLWWYNARSRREFLVDDEVKVMAEWHVSLRTHWADLAWNDPRRSQGPFCVIYLALKDAAGLPLIEYKGDRTPMPEPTVCLDESSPSVQSFQQGAPSGAHQARTKGQ